MENDQSRNWPSVAGPLTLNQPTEIQRVFYVSKSWDDIANTWYQKSQAIEWMSDVPHNCVFRVQNHHPIFFDTA
jgi:hypothetical protein